MPTGRAPQKSLFEASDWQKAQAFEDRAYDALSMYSQRPATISEVKQELPDPTVLDAALDFVMNSDAWKTDILPRIGPALKDAAIAAGTGVTQAHFDLTYLLTHTAHWAVDKFNGGDMEWLGDMPRFAELQGSSDWLAEQLFNQDTDSMAYGFGGLLSPDPASAGKVASLLQAGDPATLKAMFGGLFATSTRAAMREGARVSDLSEQGVDRVLRREQAIKMAGEGLSPQNILKETGWMKQPDGNWAFHISDVGAKVRMDKMEELAAKQMTQAPFHQSNDGKMIVEVETTLGEVFDHPALYEEYPELAKLKFKYHMIPDEDETGQIWMRFPNQDEATNTLGQFIPNQYDIRDSTIGKYAVSNSTFTGEGGYAGNVNPAVTETILHELQHGIQFIEGWAQGGQTLDIPHGFFESSRLTGLGYELFTTMSKMGKNNPAQWARLPDETKLRIVKAHLGDIVLPTDPESKKRFVATIMSDFSPRTEEVQRIADTMALPKTDAMVKELYYRRAWRYIDRLFMEAGDKGDPAKWMTMRAEQSKNFIDWANTYAGENLGTFNKESEIADRLRGYNADMLSWEHYKNLGGEVQSRITQNTWRSMYELAKIQAKTQGIPLDEALLQVAEKQSRVTGMKKEHVQMFLERNREVDVAQQILTGQDVEFPSFVFSDPERYSKGLAHVVDPAGKGQQDLPIADITADARGYELFNPPSINSKDWKELTLEDFGLDDLPVFDE